MAVLRLLLIAALLAPIASGQTTQPNNPSDLTILKSSWNASARISETDHGVPEPDESSIEMVPRFGRPGPSSNPLLTKTPTTRGFQYKLTIRNDGSKTITGMVWDYVFFNSKGTEVGRHHFENTKDLAIKAGKSKQIVNFSISHPVMVISADDLGNESRMDGRVEILRVDYEDGSSWNRPPREASTSASSQ